MIRELAFLSPLHPTLGATERRNLGTDVLAPISFLPWWDDAAQCQAFDLIRGLIEILVPFTSSSAIVISSEFFGSTWSTTTGGALIEGSISACPPEGSYLLPRHSITSIVTT